MADAAEDDGCFFSGDNERGGVFAVDALRARPPLDLVKAMYVTVVPNKARPTSHWKLNIWKVIWDGVDS